jgi:carbon-monoxide dehydrogenase medium subunit
MLGAAVSLTVANDRITDARIAMLNMADIPVRLRAAESMLIGEAPAETAFVEAAELAIRDLTPPADLHASSAYRRHVGRAVVRRALCDAGARA